MNDRMREQCREIISEAQMRINQVAPGRKVLLVETERSEEEIRTDVYRALQDASGVEVEK